MLINLYVWGGGCRQPNFPYNPVVAHANDECGDGLLSFSSLLFIKQPVLSLNKLKFFSYCFLFLYYIFGNIVQISAQMASI